MSCLLLGLSSCQQYTTVSPPPLPMGATLNSTAAEGHPRLSYNGRYLVFASDRQSQRTIQVYDLQRRRLVPLPGLNQEGILQDQPDISADGRYIVYMAERYGKPDIFIYDRQTFRSEAITRDILGVVRHPTISGNGRFIAFEINRSGQWDIEIYDRGADIDLSLPQQNTPPSPNN
nr:biopolymer transporter [Spirulina sp. CS-785/01]